MSLVWKGCILKGVLLYIFRFRGASIEQRLEIHRLVLVFNYFLLLLLGEDEAQGEIELGRNSHFLTMRSGLNFLALQFYICIE